jgi:truncated hemoglobin YjbI
MAEQAVAAEVPGQGVAPVAPIDPNAPKPGERVYDIKYPDGRVEKRGESWLQQRAEKSIGLEKRVADADKYEKAFNNFVAKVQDPTQLVELLNHPDLKYDEEKQAALITSALGSKKPRVIEAVKRWLYDNEVKPSLMDPKDREAMEWKNKAEALESDKLKREKEIREDQEARNVAQIKEAYRVKLGEAFTKSGLPTQEFLVRQVMEKARLYVRSGQHPDFDNCCKLVQQDFIEQVKGVLGKATVDNILSLMDGETPKTINKALMKALNKPDEVIQGREGTKPKRKEKEMTPQERKKWLRNLERGIID